MGLHAIAAFSTLLTAYFLELSLEQWIDATSKPNCPLHVYHSGSRSLNFSIQESEEIRIQLPHVYGDPIPSVSMAAANTHLPFHDLIPVHGWPQIVGVH